MLLILTEVIMVLSCAQMQMINLILIIHIIIVIIIALSQLLLERDIRLHPYFICSGRETMQGLLA